MSQEVLKPKYIPEELLDLCIRGVVSTREEFLLYHSNNLPCSFELSDLDVWTYPHINAITYVEGNSKSAYKKLEVDTIEKIANLQDNVGELKTYLEGLEVYKEAELSYYINSLDTTSLRKALFDVLVQQGYLNRRF